MNNRLVFFSVLVLGLLLAGFAGWSFHREGKYDSLFPYIFLASCLSFVMAGFMYVEAGNVKPLLNAKPNESFQVQAIGPTVPPCEESVTFFFARNQRGQVFSLYAYGDAVPHQGSWHQLRDWTEIK